ncbi:hypothetical protein D0Y65_043410 [Glycine soja]|uniref:Uncharacterized protein n=1 Tax=Glycine soja TaxID=3848 RepID=A0A445GHF2_GLYSO|nr:hypothetical protein D0Y65_043410 [Glycine soja]
MPPPSTIIPEPSTRERGHTVARVDLSQSFDTTEDEVFEVTPNVPSLSANKRKRNERAGESGQRNMSKAPFSLLMQRRGWGSFYTFFHCVSHVNFGFHYTCSFFFCCSATIEYWCDNNRCLDELASFFLCLATPDSFCPASAIPSSSSCLSVSFDHVYTSLEVNLMCNEVAKWRATARIIWRMKRPKMANATIALAKAIRHGNGVGRGQFLLTPPPPLTPHLLPTLATETRQGYRFTPIPTPDRDVKDGQLLDEDEIVVREENDEEGDHEANV